MLEFWRVGALAFWGVGVLGGWGVSVLGEVGFREEGVGSRQSVLFSQQ